MKNKSILILFLTVFFMLAGTMVYLNFANKPTKIMTNNIVGTKPEIDFTFPGLDGKQLTFTDWRGKIVVLNFWATWCPPCLREIPLFNKMQKKWQDMGVQFVGLALDEKENVEVFIEQTAVNYPIMLGEFGSMQIAKDLGNRLNALPYTVVFDQSGTVVTVRAGEVTETMLQKVINPIL